MSATIDALSEALSPRYADFIRNAMTRPATCSLEDFDRSALPEFLRQYQNPMQRWPVIVSKERHEQFGRVATGLVRLLRNVVSLAFGDDFEQAKAYFRLDEDVPMRRLFASRRGLDYCIARGDFVLTENGPKLLEFNMGPGIGGWQINMFERLYRSDPHISWVFSDTEHRLTTTNPIGLMIAHAFATAQRQFAERISPDAINVGVAVPPELKSSAQELIFARRPSAKGSAGGGGRVFSFAEDATVENADGVVRINGQDAHAIVALTYAHKTWVVERFQDAFERGEIVLLNAPAPVVLGNKCAVALLSELADSHRLDVSNQALVSAAVPWTRRVERGIHMQYTTASGPLQEIARKFQDRLVLKPDDDTNGNGVVIGRYADKGRWKVAVEEALHDGHYVVQEYCSSRLLYAPANGQVQPHRFVWSAFVFGDAFAGSYVRMMPDADRDGVINCYRGATEAIVFQHD